LREGRRRKEGNQAIMKGGKNKRERQERKGRRKEGEEGRENSQVWARKKEGREGGKQMERKWNLWFHFVDFECFVSKIRKV
jgi:hypothetical protein